MKTKEIIERSQKFIVPYRVTNGKKFRLKDFDPNDTGEATSEDKPQAKELLERGVEVLAELQDVLYVQDQWLILLIFQAMDAAGKMVRSSTSCPASMRKAARSSHSRVHQQKILITTLCGAV
jgi:polyphosphate kinase 2 (PPK2 family)